MRLTPSQVRSHHSFIFCCAISRNVWAHCIRGLFLFTVRVIHSLICLSRDAKKKRSLFHVAFILLLNNVYLELYASNVVPVDTTVYFGWFFLLNSITLMRWAMLKVVYE